MEEAEAIKAAQRTAKEDPRLPKGGDKEKGEQGSRPRTSHNITAPSNRVSGPPQQKRAPEGGMARWLARSAVQGCAV